MVKSRHSIAVVLAVLAAFIALLYFFLFRPYVALAYDGEAPGWFQSVLQALYPRFEVEKQRFDLSFFQYKADQVLIRTLLSAAALIFLLLRYSIATITRHYSIIQEEPHFRMLGKIFYAGLFLYSWNWYMDFSQVIKMEEFYKGVHLYSLFGISLLPLEAYYWLFVVYLLSIALTFVGFRPVIFSSVAALLLVFFQGYFYSFEKIDHGYTTLTYAAMLMPFLYYELKQQGGQSGSKRSFVLFLIQFTIASCYFLAGVEKLLTSGFQWASAETFTTYIKLHQQDLGLWIIQYEILTLLLPLMALIFQLCFILILFIPRYWYLFLLGGIGFHWGTRLLLGVGSFFSSWIFVYIFFLPWNSFFKKLRSSSINISRSQKGA
jgi:hypothetical protein